MKNGIDYKVLLAKYMRHVRQCEGADFVDHVDDRLMGLSEVKFGADEKAELERMSAIIEADLWGGGGGVE